MVILLECRGFIQEIILEIIVYDVCHQNLNLAKTSQPSYK